MCQNYMVVHQHGPKGVPEFSNNFDQELCPQNFIKILLPTSR